jgi:preprotein translocase subunit YajC
MHILEFVNLGATTCPAPTGAAGIAPMIPIFLVFGVMMYFMFRSQKKQAKEREAMLSAIKIGDEIITNGGIKGTITKVKDKSFFVKVADKVDLEIVRNGVATVIKLETEDSEGSVEEKK